VRGADVGALARIGLQVVQRLRGVLLAGAPGGAGGRPAPYQQQDAAQALYDLKADPGERTDVSAAHPDVVARLLAAAEALRAELGDTATGRKGTAVRPADRLAADDERLRW
jgi:hypothetical protein